MRRSSFWLLLVALLVLHSACVPARAPGAAGPPAPEPQGPVLLKLGVIGANRGYLPFYVLTEHTARLEGLAVEIVNLNSGSAVMQTLASGSLDVGLVGLNVVLNAIEAGQSVRVFYGGILFADYQWFAHPSIQTWSDLRGKSIGVSSSGSLTDLLTRTVLARRGLDPQRDVQIIAVGGSAMAAQALQAERIDLAILTNPAAWQVEADGFKQLGSMATELVEVWPQNLLAARQEGISSSQGHMRALLRAHVRALRLIETNRELAVDTLMRYARLERADAERSYDELLPYLNEHGAMPDRAMPLFWEVMKTTEEVPEPWEETRYLDRRFIDTFDQWAPPR